MGVPAKTRPVSEPSDAQLVARALACEEVAYTLIYRRHARHVAGLIYRILGHDHVLEDLVQETFAQGLARLDSLRAAEALGAFLRTIAVRCVQRHLAKLLKQRSLRQRLRNEEVRSLKVGGSEETIALYQALARVPDDLRLPWILHHVEGETLPVVATMCQTSLSSVKRRIRKAEQCLRRDAS